MIHPIKIENGILTYSNGVTNTGLEYFKALTRQIFTMKSNTPTKNNSVTSCLLIVIPQYLILNNSDNIVIPKLVNDKTTIGLSSRVKTLIVIMIIAVSTLSNNPLIAANILL